MRLNYRGERKSRAPIRIEKMMELAGAARAREAELQEKYAAAVSARKN